MKKIKKIAEKSTQPQETSMVLKKHVGLIHCENKLTLIQRKICNVLLFNALDNIHQQEIHEINLRKLCSLVGYQSNDTQLIKDSIKTLISTVMEWNLLEDNKFLADQQAEKEITWSASALLAGATINKGLIRYSYSPQIKSVLSSLEIYGRINLFIQSKFNSTYSLVLYENCVRFKNIKQSCWFSLTLFRTLMGVSSDKYVSFKEFKRNVINVAVKEINLKSDICVEPLFRKSARTVTAVQFLISENENYHPSFRRIKKSSCSETQKMSLSEILKEYSLTSKQVLEITNQYSYDYILQKINLLRGKKNIQHKGAYLIAALKQDYQEIKNKISTTENNSTKLQYVREAKNAAEMIPLKNKYMSYKAHKYLDFIQSQTKEEQELIQQKFIESIQTKKEILRFQQKSGLSSPFVMAEFILFIDNYFPNILQSYLSFDDFVTGEIVTT